MKKKLLSFALIFVLLFSTIPMNAEAASLKSVKLLNIRATSQKVTLKWSKVSKAKKYQIYRSTSPNSGFKKIKTTKKRSFVSKKYPSQGFYYKVRAIKGKKKGGFSPIKYVAPSGAVQNPIDVVRANVSAQVIEQKVGVGQSIIAVLVTNNTNDPMYVWGRIYSKSVVVAPISGLGNPSTYSYYTSTLTNAYGASNVGANIVSPKSKQVIYVTALGLTTKLNLNFHAVSAAFSFNFGRSKDNYQAYFVGCSNTPNNVSIRTR